jgi:NAD(P)-dependent dehydrogenase (short-subunit alcohol dehydrogenase family)
VFDAGIRAVGRRCDVSKLDEVEALADKAIKTFGNIHVACNNAGGGIPTSARRMKLADWKWIIDVDLWGPIYGVKVFLPLIEAAGEGHINATSSMAGLISSQMMGAYNVAKHGVVALMAATERELRSKKSPITASVLCPGPINTNISRNSVGFRPGKAKPKADSEKAGKMASNIQASLDITRHFACLLTIRFRFGFARTKSNRIPADIGVYRARTENRCRDRAFFRPKLTFGGRH